MPGRGKGAGRKRKASEALQDRGDGERVHILEEQAPQQGKVIDFEEIISKSLMLPLSNENLKHRGVS